jgi:hypothetical protein
MKLDTNPFPVSMIELEHKKILVCTDQDETTKGKNVVVSDDLRNRMIMPHNPKIGMWKENVQRKPAKRVKPMSDMLIEKYQWQLEEDRGTGSPEESNGIDSSRPGTDPVGRRFSVVEISRGGWRTTLPIRNPE